MGFIRVEARCQITNPASPRVLEKIGMQREGVVRGRAHSKAPEEDFWLYAVQRGGADAADR
jgi:RimJ/RimL family protein N-acetyltransferase